MIATPLYAQNPNIRIIWDGQNPQSGQPAALEMAGGRVYIEDGFTNHLGEEVSFLPDEQAAVLLAGAGFDERSTQRRIDKWRSPDAQDSGAPSSVERMQQKLDVAGMLAGEAAIALAFEKGLLVQDERPDMNFIDRARRWDFVQTVRLLGSNRSFSAICETLRKRATEVIDIIGTTAEDMALEWVERPGQALVMLAGMNDMLPRYTKNNRPLSLHSLLLSDRSDSLSIFFPGGQQKTSIWMSPFDDDNVRIRFAGQPGDQRLPDPHVGAIDRIRIREAVIDVNNPVVNERTGERLLTPRELAAFVLRSAGMTTAEVAKRTAAWGSKGDPQLPTKTCKKILKTSIVQGPGPNRFAEMTTKAAFEQGIYIRRRGPDLRGIEEEWRRRLEVIGEALTLGKTNKEIGEYYKEKGITESPLAIQTILSYLTELKGYLDVQGTAALALIAEANNPKYPLVPLGPNEDLGYLD